MLSTTFATGEHIAVSQHETISRSQSEHIAHRWCISRVLRSCSSIGANSYEAKYAQSTADFVSKLEIALKECYETDYWLEILYKVGAIDENTYKTLANKCGAIRRKLIASITTAKENS